MSSPEKDFPESEMSSDPTVMPGFDGRRPLTPEEMAMFSEPVDIVRSTSDVQVLAAPLGSYDRLELEPWPPLSREQVVELHEALRDFVTDMTSARGPMSDEDQANTIWSAAVELHGTLERLGIGAPPTTKRWSEALLQEVVEKVQEQRHPFEQQYPADFPPAKDSLFKASDIKVDPMLPPGTMAMVSPLGGTVVVNVGTYPAVYRTVEEPTSTLVTSPLGVKKNCGTCQRGSTPLCPLIEKTLEHKLERGDVVNWRLQQQDKALSEMDNCPGWEQKP